MNPTATIELLARQEELLAENDRIIVNQDKLLADKDRIIAELHKERDEKDHIIAELLKERDEKDNNIAELRKERDELKKEIAKFGHHEHAPLPAELQNFTTIKELEALSDIRQRTRNCFLLWKNTSYQDGEACEDYRASLLELWSRVSEEALKMKNDDGLLLTFRAVIAAGYDCFNGVYDSLWHNIEMSEGEDIARYREMGKAVNASIQASKTAGYKPQQMSGNLIELFRSFSSSESKFNRNMKRIVSEVPGSNWNIAPPKDAFRMTEKACLRISAQGKGYALVLDAGRGMVEASSMNVVCNIKQAVLDLAATRSDFWVIRNKQRYLFASGGGWRDDLMNLVVEDGGTYHIFEIQICHGRMLTARKTLDGHAVFNKTRNATELLVSRYGDNAELLAILLLKAGDEVTQWAQDNGWFVARSLDDWKCVLHDETGFCGLDMTDMPPDIFDQMSPELDCCNVAMKHVILPRSGQ